MQAASCHGPRRFRTGAFQTTETGQCRCRAHMKGIVTTDKTWKIIVHDLKAVDEHVGLENVRREVQAFLGWAGDGLRALDDLAPKR